MRHLFLVLIGLILSVNPAAANPDPQPTVYPAPFVDVMHARHDGDFYDQQAQEWQALALGNCTEEDAWFHYYKTARYSNRFGSGDYDLTAILAQAQPTLDPEGFVWNYLNFVADQDLVTRWPKLLRAHAADPDRHEAYTSLIAHYTIENNLALKDETLRKLHVAEPIPNGVMEYNYNQLMSVAPNGILITHGDSDTYPTWLLQSTYKVRPDILVISLPLLMNFSEYQKHIKAALRIDKLFAQAPYDAAGLLEQLTTQQRPIFFAATGQQHLPELPADRLYLTGLAFQYSTGEVDNIGLLAKNYVENWRLESLSLPLTDSPAQAVADQLNQNYLPALLELNNFNQAHPDQHIPGVFPLLEKLAQRAGISETVSSYLSSSSTPPQLASNNPGLRAKDIYKGTAYIPDGTLYLRNGEALTQVSDPITVRGFFLQEAEVSNADYQLFLEDLLRQRKFDMLDSVAVSPLKEADIENTFPAESNFQAVAVHLTGSNPAFANYPLINVSRRAAELYAIWLAQVYNQDPKRIDGKNVRFRLPQEAEFAFAAQGGRTNHPYPWGGPYYRNAKGCLLGNFNTLAPESRENFKAWQDNIKASTKLTAKEKADILERKDTDEGCDWENDGGYLTVATRSYFPNDYGLYNMSGNAAEMLAEEGKTMGGSWMDPAYLMQIGVVKERTLPHPSTGFRLIMEYLD
ncbi:formylglycine-generating enzyme family protein [Neolewinella persica]|uniref:formylglycine-generating enzyme family protein n=1 Tax=Neolewinella persica TaxID=70998 RepID=UPI000360F63A|nr:SUMF1/EgtB/PvdO family nonheme iron enzyme [Neolewinella persica]